MTLATTTFPTRGRRGPARELLTCDELPGWIGDSRQAAAIAGVCRATVYTGMREKRPIGHKGLTFRRESDPAPGAVAPFSPRCVNDLAPSIRDLTDEQIIERGRQVVAKLRSLQPVEAAHD